MSRGGGWRQEWACPVGGGARSGHVPWGVVPGVSMSGAGACQGTCSAGGSAIGHVLASHSASIPLNDDGTGGLLGEKWGKPVADLRCLATIRMVAVSLAPSMRYFQR